MAEAPDVAYRDILNEFDRTWRVKNLIVTHSNLDVTFMNRPQMSIISWVSLELRRLAQVG